ncbi:hypothetical protein BD311DRAFT_809836 [Dichomitus squalens]|uniref:Uncharacterized protein n=1 Tax=Dichomitus squalens TaxID=114155 RepID=A0A4Q9MBK5_9APHY|nr:hypothetical protein BD311DRAFT_809836 [Dichomitus squalens]
MHPRSLRVTQGARESVEMGGTMRSTEVGWRLRPCIGVLHTVVVPAALDSGTGGRAREPRRLVRPTQVPKAPAPASPKEGRCAHAATAEVPPATFEASSKDRSLAEGRRVSPVDSARPPEVDAPDAPVYRHPCQ